MTVPPARDARSVPLDDNLVDALIDGRVDPADAPPELAEVVSLLNEARQVTPRVGDADEEMIAAIAATVKQSRGRRHDRRNVVRRVVWGKVIAITATTAVGSGVAAAAEHVSPRPTIEAPGVSPGAHDATGPSRVPPNAEAGAPGPAHIAFAPGAGVAAGAALVPVHSSWPGQDGTTSTGASTPAGTAAQGGDATPAPAPRPTPGPAEEHGAHGNQPAGTDTSDLAGGSPSASSSGEGGGRYGAGDGAPPAQTAPSSTVTLAGPHRTSSTVPGRAHGRPSAPDATATPAVRGQHHNEATEAHDSGAPRRAPSDR